MTTSQTEKQTKLLKMKRVPLPIDSALPEIEQAVRDYSSVIVVAEPGAGKTTRVPPALLSLGKWIVLQPRRWAAKLTAERIAEENSWKLGEEVGFQVRFENKTSTLSQLIVMTEGVLVRKLIQDPELKGIQGVILDEFHERSLDLDLALSLLKEIQDSLRPELKIVVMSATLDPAPLQKFLGHVKVFNISGRTYPVTHCYLGQVSVLSAVKTAMNRIEVEPEFEEGDFLIFLPGAYEIQKAVREIESYLESEGLIREIEVLPLYSSLLEHEQKKVFQDSFTAKGKRKRKIICSTNIAETSITLPFIKIVIDQGFGKFMRTDPQLGLDRLETLRISRASAEQRAGRAGRVSSGIAYRLWTEGDQMQLRHFETPEIHRVSLSDAILMLSEFGVSDFQSFPWYERPKSSMLAYSISELERLSFLKDGRITEAGKKALKLPLGPVLAKLVIEAEAVNSLSFAARLAAWMENQTASRSVVTEERLLEELNQLNGNALKSALQIMGKAKLENLTFQDWPKYEAILVRAFPTKVFRNGLMVGRRKVFSKDQSQSLPLQGLILNSIERVERGSTQVLLQSYVPLSNAVLEDGAKKKRNVYWDDLGKRVRTVEGVFFQDLELGTVTEVSTLPLDAEALLLEMIIKNPREILSENKAFLRWLERMDFYQKWTDPAEPEVQWEWRPLLEAAVSGKTRIDQVLSFPFQEYLEGMFDRKFLAKWNEWVPDKIEVPSLSHHAINYQGAQPKLSVRLQEVFGWLETPRIMGGKAPLLIELLSPSFKPIQVTQDLKSFWKTAYFEVKKELKARYPKHSWPDDPLTAKAEAKGRRRNY